MTKYIYVVITLLICAACTPNTSYQVHTVSAMKKVMMGEDLTAHLNYDTLPRPHLFALSPLERIEGEVTVLDGAIYTSQVDDDNQVIINQNWNVHAPFAVYAQVKKWKTYEIYGIASENDLQTIIENLARKNGMNLDTAFPFRVQGQFSNMDYHIISKPTSELTHNHDLHHKAKKHFQLTHTTGELLGFYSQNHIGVFTHKGHFIHTHYIDEKKEHMGHVENVSTTRKVKILLPRI